jgi:repressor LexA
VHRIQEQLLQLAAQTNLGAFSLRDIGEMIGPQKIKHHLNQLEKRGLIRVDRASRTIEKTASRTAPGLLTNARLLMVPLLGSANAGPALLFADQNIEGYLKISSTFLERRANRKLFALR